MVLATRFCCMHASNSISRFTLAPQKLLLGLYFGCTAVDLHIFILPNVLIRMITS
jgi:hypothetical protein